MTRSQFHIPSGFAAGTLIDTMQGLMSVENVKLGMALRLPDGGSATVMWRHACAVTQPGAIGGTHPIVISRGAFGRRRPCRDLVVCAQQRILIGHPAQWPSIAGGPALVPARALLGQPGVSVLRDKTSVTWVQLACRGHHVLSVQGCLTETALLDPAFLANLPALERLRLTALFARQPPPGAPLNGPPAYPCQTFHEGRRLMAAARLRV